MQISQRALASGNGASTAVPDEFAAAAETTQVETGEPWADFAAVAGDLRAAFAGLFGLEQAPLHGDAASTLVLLKDGPSNGTAGADPKATSTVRQRAQDALKTAPQPPASHPWMQHIRDVQAQLKKEGLPTDAQGVHVYVVDTAQHGAMVTRTLAGPAGLAQQADVELAERLPDRQLGELPDEERAEHNLAALSVKTGMATSAQVKMYAVDAIVAAYTQPKAELDYLVAHAPKDGQTKIVNMSWGTSEDALVAEATNKALEDKNSPLIEELNDRRAQQRLPAVDISKPEGKEEVRKFVAGVIGQALRAPDVAKRIDAARAEATAAVAKARQAGFLPIAAAGNFFEPGRTADRSATNENLVATIPGVLSVGSVALGDATKKGDETMGDTSSTGAAIAAPGVGVPVDVDKRTKRSVDQSGTSLAAPYAASVAALMIKANPNITPAQIEKILRSPAVTSDVKGTTRDGAGVIDPVAAVRAAKALHASEPAFHTAQDLDPAARRAALDALRQLLPATAPTYKAALDVINDDHFVELDVATQKNLLAGLGARGADRTLAQDVRALAASREFNDLGPAARARFAQTFVALEPAERLEAMKLLTRRDFASLPVPIRDALCAAAAKAPDDRETIGALLKRVQDPAFKKLPADAQVAFLRAFESQHDSIEIDSAAANKAALLGLIDSAAFKKLDATAQSRWMQALGSPEASVRDRGYERLADAVKRTAKQPDAEKAAVLNSYAGALDAADTVRTDRKQLPGASKSEWHVSLPQDEQRSVFFAANGKGIDPKKADVTVQTVTIDGQRIEVIYPRPKPVNLPSAELIAQGLAGLPATERATVRQVIVDPRLKGYMQAVSAKDGRPSRVFMGGEVPDNPREMSAMLSHETAHLLSADRFKTNPALRVKWEAAIRDDNHRVSGYAATTLQEDVAETVALYYQVKGTADEAVMQRDFPHRYALVKELLGEQ